MVMNKFRNVRKRDGAIVGFDQNRITRAIYRAMQAAREGDASPDSKRISDDAVAELNRRYPEKHVPQIEEIQDVVEESLILEDFTKTAKAYILYRTERARVREAARAVPERVKRLAAESRKYFPNALAEFVYYRTYSRWIEEEGRRETWIETVDRYLGFMRETLKERLTEPEYAEIRAAILELKVMPSMRLMWSAGQAARATNVAAYNCAFIAPARPDDLAEIMYLLMCGTGVGFSVESGNIQRFPIVARQSGEKRAAHAIGDSKEGWCDALKLALATWYSGSDIEFDYSRLRPSGARLRTMGGRSSGPGPLKTLLDFARARILARQGRRLTSLDVHDLICKIGETIVMGGVRRSALISLSDFDDREMREAKQGYFFINHPERSLANDSAAYDSRPSSVEFLEEWLALARSGSGERGIFNRGGILEQVPRRRRKFLERELATTGINPCGEVILRSKQFCNLTEIVARPGDTEETLLAKARIAAILGTFQSMLTSFPYLSGDWMRKCEEERLLGVSITGLWDSPVARDEATLRNLRDVAVRTNREYAERFGINASTAVTCVKPSGTVSQLVDSASGMHPRHARYYLRRVRISGTDPLFAMLRDQKFPHHPEVGEKEGEAATYVLDFPVRAPEGSVTGAELSARAQLENWKATKLAYTEHNPSVTVSVAPDEWVKTAEWVYENWGIVGGLSFLPRADSVYRLSPYEEITKEEYDARVASLPSLDFGRLSVYEKEDRTTGAKDLACVGAVCELAHG
jgi:ribonucleoside-diphosphate reductase alpha chain